MTDVGQFLLFALIFVTIGVVILVIHIGLELGRLIYHLPMIRRRIKYEWELIPQLDRHLQKIAAQWNDPRPLSDQERIDVAVHTLNCWGSYPERVRQQHDEDDRIRDLAEGLRHKFSKLPMAIDYDHLAQELASVLMKYEAR